MLSSLLVMETIMLEPFFSGGAVILRGPPSPSIRCEKDSGPRDLQSLTPTLTMVMEPGKFLRQIQMFSMFAFVRILIWRRITRLMFRFFIGSKMKNIWGSLEIFLLG